MTYSILAEGLVKRFGDPVALYGVDLAVIDHGTVIATGTPEELKARAGALTLAVRPTDPADVAAVTAIVARYAGTEPEVRNTTVTAPVADEDVMPAVVARLQEAGVRVAELTLRGASLDEVFLSLTGHRTEEAASTDERSVAA